MIIKNDIGTFQLSRDQIQLLYLPENIYKGEHHIIAILIDEKYYFRSFHKIEENVFEKNKNSDSSEDFIHENENEIDQFEVQ